MYAYSLQWMMLEGIIRLVMVPIIGLACKATCAIQSILTFLCVLRQLENKPGSIGSRQRRTIKQRCTQSLDAAGWYHHAAGIITLAREVRKRITFFVLATIDRSSQTAGFPRN